ncbi:MAG: CRTAC1 family protein [Planctomycetota bacterium]
MTRRGARRLGFLILFWSVGSAATLEAQLPFTQEALSRGVYYVTPWWQWWGAFGNGVLLNDLDNDGDLDLLLCGRLDGTVSVYENDGTGYFTDRTLGSGLPVGVEYHAACAGDYDGDGAPDVFISGYYVPSLLLRNTLGLTFTDVTTSAGISNSGAAQGATWGDYNGDGWLDLYVTNRTGTILGDVIPNRLYRNLGNGTFVDEAALEGVDAAHFSLQATFYDHDRDGDADLYLSTDKGEPEPPGHQNRLWRNDAGHFVEISAVSGTDVAIDSMGLAIGDLDRNGYPDLYCTNVPQAGNPLLMNQGDGTYLEEQDLAGVGVHNYSGWGTMFLDFDNDGRLDLFVTSSPGPNLLFRSNATLPLVDVAAAYALQDSGYGAAATKSSYGAIAGDIDSDGDLDLVVQSFLEPVAIFINHEGSTRNWCKLRLAGIAPNLSAIGATVALIAAGLVQTSEVMAGTSYKSSGPFELHFGVDTLPLIEQIIVYWPGGTHVTVLENLPVNTTITVDQAATQFADCNGNLIADTLEIATGSSLDLNGNEVPDECELRFVRADANVDGLVELSDAITVLGYLFTSGAIPCVVAADINDSRGVDLADAVYLLSYLFVAGPPPPPPFGACGIDPTPPGSGVLLACDDAGGCV